jgi:hypothetical protein
VNLGQGVGLGADGTDNTGQGDNVGQGEDRLLETEEEGRPGNVGGERDPVEVEALDGGWWRSKGSDSSVNLAEEEDSEPASRADWLSREAGLKAPTVLALVASMFWAIRYEPKPETA